MFQVAGQWGDIKRKGVISTATSKKEATEAARVLRDPKSSKREKSLAGGDLSNARKKK
jgi:hypothetical protein